MPNCVTVPIATTSHLVDLEQATAAELAKAVDDLARLRSAITYADTAIRDQLRARLDEEDLTIAAAGDYEVEAGEPPTLQEMKEDMRYISIMLRKHVYPRAVHVNAKRGVGPDAL